MNQETKVGFFLIGALATILTSILMLGNVKLFSNRTPYLIDFRDVEALPPKAAVKIAGVEIGKVEKVRLVNGRALVSIRIDKEIVLYADARGRIGSTGVIGTRFVELVPGTSQNPALQPGALIQGESVASLNDMIAKVSGLFDEDEQYGSAIGNLKATLSHIRNVSAALDMAMGQRSADLQAIVSNIRDLTQSAKVFTQHLEEITTERKDDVKVALANFKDVSVKLNEILEKINTGQGTLGTLINDEQTANNVKVAVADIKDTASSAKKIMGRFTSVHTFWDFRYRYDITDAESRADLGLTFVPRPGKYYSLGVTNINADKPTQSTQYERNNRITATMGAELGPFIGYAGAIRSRGGAGLYYKPLKANSKWKDRVQLQAEISDLARDEVVNGTTLDNPWVAAGAHVAALKWLWVGARVEDIIDRPTYFLYSNINFNDEDLAYLLGLAGASRW